MHTKNACPTSYMRRSFVLIAVISFIAHRCGGVHALDAKSSSKSTITAVANDDAKPTGDARKWSVQQVSSWLRGSGLASLERAFAKHKISGDVLCVMQRGDIVDLLSREKALVYGDVVRLDLAMDALELPGRMSSQARLQQQYYHPGGQGMLAIQGGPEPVRGLLQGWSTVGLVIFVIVGLALVSPEVRKVLNIATQLFSIQLWYCYRRLLGPDGWFMRRREAGASVANPSKGAAAASTSPRG